MAYSVGFMKNQTVNTLYAANMDYLIRSINHPLKVNQFQQTVAFAKAKTQMSRPRVGQQRNQNKNCFGSISRI